MNLNNPHQIELGMNLSPAEWLNECRKTIKKAREKGFYTSHIERAQSRVFNQQKQNFLSGVK